MITSELQLLKTFDCESREKLQRNLYKYTDCGAWVEFKKDRVLLGSIVEGCAFGTAIYVLRYDPGFTVEDFDARISAIEKEANDIWKWANEGPTQKECEQIGLDYEEWLTWADIGLDAPDTSCEFWQFEQEGRSA